MSEQVIHRYWRALLTLVLCFTVSAVFADEPYIANIRFEGNAKTKPSILLQEMVIKVGDPVDDAKIETSRQNILNLGLFKAVTADVIGEGPDKELLISVKERYFILPLPLLDVRPDGTYSYGIDLHNDNLFGLNQRLKISYEDKRSIDVNGEPAKAVAVDYDYPHIVGTPYSLGMHLKLSREDVNGEEDGYPNTFYELSNDSYSLNVSRWLNETGTSSGWYSGLGFVINRREYTYVSGLQSVYIDGLLLSGEASLGYKNIKDNVYYRSGTQYGYRLSLGLPQMGSDFSYNSNLLFYRRYLPLDVNKANLNSQFRIGLANGSTFGNQVYNVGGYDTVRGYDSGSGRGNALFLANIEYLHQISGFNQLRAMLFTDIGNAWPAVKEMSLDDVHASLGAGLRWRVLSFVDLHLSLESAYNLESENWTTYFNTSGSF